MTESWRLWVNPLGGLPLFVWWLASSSLSSTPSTWSEELMSNHNEQTFSDDVNPDLCCGSHQTTSWIHSASSSSCSGERYVLSYTFCSWLSFNLVQVALRETFELLDNPECDKLGRQSWVVITIVVTELLICIKFGWGASPQLFDYFLAFIRWATITKPLPRHIALWWVLGAALLLVYTVVKFYLLKPNHVPQPEKEHIRVGSPLGSSTGAGN